jgi:hypothetical protein
MRHAILLFAIVNACLYSGLLPLWEGFDEAFQLCQCGISVADA